MAPRVGRRIVDREIDLDKLRTAIGCGSEANDFLKGKVILISGGARGQGAAEARYSLLKERGSLLAM
jgi:hypothetical protein